MHRRKLGIGLSVATPSAGQSDISAAVDHLAHEVARLALQMKLMESMAHATEVVRAAGDLRTAAHCPTKDDNPQLRTDVECYDGISALILNNSIAPVLMSANTVAARTESAEPKAAGPEFTVGQGESAIAVGILNLHNRLGSFIKS